MIYCINKITGYKVASFYSLQKDDPEFSFWNQKDSRIDSLDTELTDDIRRLIQEVSKDKGAKTNRFLLSDELRVKEEQSFKNYHGEKMMVGEDRIPAPREIGYDEPVMEQPREFAINRNVEIDVRNEERAMREDVVATTFRSGSV